MKCRAIMAGTRWLLATIYILVVWSAWNIKIWIWIWRKCRALFLEPPVNLKDGSEF
jgi:hypothetical protein